MGIWWRRNPIKYRSYHLLGRFASINFNPGLDTYNLNLKEYSNNSNKKDLSDIEVTLKLTGLDGTIGLVFRIQVKKK